MTLKYLPLTRAQIVDGTGFARGATFVQLSAPIAQALNRYPGMAEAFNAIVAELDGEAWTPDTLDAIAGHLREAGAVIRDVGEVEPPEPDMNAPDEAERAEQHARIQREFKR